MPTPTSIPNLRQLADRDQRVFATYPLVARYFPAAAIEDARQRLTRAIERGDGPGLVIGAPGTGKSLLLQVIATQYHAKFDIVLLACARLCTRRALLQAVLFELGLPYKTRDEGDLRLSLLDHLLSDQCPAGLLMLVDEAQALPVALLDELRILTNLVRAGKPRVRLVLAGSSTLEEAFANPTLESFSQRLAARCYLSPLNREETRQYIVAQIAACGATPETVIDPGIPEAVFDATDGVPRLVNQLCDRALQMAVAAGRPIIDRQTIQEAWSDLQQLPTPWDTPIVDGDAEKSEVVEFGVLSADQANDSDPHELDSVLDDGTELDVELASFETRITTAPSTPAATPATADPFSEAYEEEEVVLDNFAAWDDMFSRNVPRVANRRDPGFSSMVQSAIAASPAPASRVVVSAAAATTGSVEATAADRPRLKLADVPESIGSEFMAAPAVSTAKAPPREELSQSVGSSFVDELIEKPTTAREEAMLIIEDDVVQPTQPSPVRREEYRNLFSRLRSG